MTMTIISEVTRADQANQIARDAIQLHCDWIERPETDDNRYDFGVFLEVDTPLFS